MAVDVLLGLQWGDEGKGKVVDLFAPRYDIVARFQGGPNAGHTLTHGATKHVLHQIPSGIFHPEVKNLIGNGVVIDPIILKEEIEALDKLNVDVRKNLFISKKTQIILPTHRLLDATDEKAKGKQKIGSTLKGISPAYQDKAGRSGIRVGDILKNDFKAKYNELVSKHKRILKVYALKDFKNDLEKSEHDFFNSIQQLKKLNIIESEYFINDALSEGLSVLAEGAQGSMLDVDFGSYPYVTSSNTIVAAACTGLGIAPQKINKVFGIFKAYCTRVGSGPFPTELFNSDGERLRESGKEFGATTGRPRRCGWLDIPSLKYAIMINGVTELLMMKADVLGGFETVKVCTQYNLKNGTVIDTVPFDLLNEIKSPVYKSFSGWPLNVKGKTLSELKEYDDLPTQIKEYISFLEENLKLSINFVSLGPDRNQTLIKNGYL